MASTQHDADDIQLLVLISPTTWIVMLGGRKIQAYLAGIATTQQKNEHFSLLGQDLILTQVDLLVAGLALFLTSEMRTTVLFVTLGRSFPALGCTIKQA